MKAYKIDVKNREVKQIEIGEHYTEISKEIGCDIFSAPHIMKDNDTLYCDDEGLLKPVDGFFLLESYPQPIAGNGLILGTDDEGESVDAKIDLETLKSRVKFMNANEAYQYALNSYTI
jgi:hypothetical protein